MDSPLHVMRSSSVSNVADLADNAVRMSRTLPLGSNSDINSHPEDYVVLDGKPVRLKKPSSAYSIEKAGLNGFNASHEFGVLRKELSGQSNSSAMEQENRSNNSSSKDLSRQARRIRELESFVPDLVAEDETHALLNSSFESTEETLESLRRASYSKRPASGQKAILSQTTSTENSAKDHAVKDTSNAVCAELLSHLDSSNSLLNDDNTTKRKKRGPPPSLAQRLALGSTERRKLNTNKTNSTASAAHVETPVISLATQSEKVHSFHSDAMLDSLHSNTIDDELHIPHHTNHSSINANGASAVSIVRKLKSSRAFNNGVSTSPTSHIENIFSPENTLILNTTLTATTTPLAQSTPLALSLPTPTPQHYKTTFFWKEQKAQLSAQGKSDIFLFIAHDNPQMGKSVATQLVDSAVSYGANSSAKYTQNVSNASNTTTTTTSGMMCMLECKDQAKPPNVHFILGKIVYSGDYHHIEGFESTQSRGSGCIVVCELRAIKCDIKALTTRNRNDIIEVDLVNLPERAAVPLKSEEDLRAFLRLCTERVDVILDPIQSHNQWYPYWEGARRMAPQFRSKGIGYLRLGDDMSQYGSAFLSLDAGVTYLDDGATSIVNTSSTPGLTNGLTSALGTPYTYCNSTAKGSALRLSRSFSGTTGGAGLAGSLHNTFGSGRFNYTYTPSGNTSHTTNTTNTMSNATPIQDTIPSGTGSGGETSSGANSSLPRSPRAAAAMNSTSKKLSFNSTTPTTATTNTNLISPRAAGAVHTGLKRTNSNHHNVVADPQWDESLSHLRECLHTIKTNDTMKWTERVELLQRLSYIMHSIATFTTIEAFVSTHYSLLCEVFTLLTETISKHTNPNVLVSAAGVVCTIEYGALLLSSGCWLPWRGLILECIHTLRSTNKMVQEAMSECLMHLYTRGSITIATLCNGSLLTDIILGTKAGAVKKGSTAAGKVATAANTVKVIQWLDIVCNTDIDLLLVRYAITSSTSTTSITTTHTTTTSSPSNTNNLPTYFNPAADIHTMVKTLLLLLSHREETTREHTIILLTTLCTLDVLHTLLPTGLSGLLLLSRKLSVDGVRKNSSNAAAAAEETDTKLKLFEDSLSPALASLLAEIKTLSARSYDKIVSLLAQRVCKHALNCAVQSASKVVETPTEISSRALKRAGSGVNLTNNISTSDILSPTGGSTSTIPVTSNSNGRGDSGSSSPHTGLATTLISPRLSFSRVGSASSSGSSERTKNTIQPSAINHSSSDLNLRISSNASTPPQNYTHTSTVSMDPTSENHSHSALISHLAPILTPRDNTIVNKLSSGVISPSNKASLAAIASANANATAEATIDKAKMQIGLQGIKSMRRGSFTTNNNSRCSTANSTSTPGRGENVTDCVMENDASHSVSRTSSASRLRRRINLTVNLDTSPTTADSSPTNSNSNIITLNPLANDTRNRSRASSSEMHLPLPTSGNNSPKSPSSTKNTTTLISKSFHPDGVDIITPRGEHCAPMRSPVVRLNKVMHPALANNTTSAITTSVNTSATVNANATTSDNSSIDIQTTLANLDPVWYEAKLLLKQVPTTEVAWEALTQIIRKSHTFFASLNALSAHTNVPKGAILRHVLPFDENTSSNDQSKGRVSPRANTSASSKSTAPTPAALVGHEENLQILAHRASELRGVIRVKMADEADVNQAATATSMLRKFIEQLEYASFTHSLTPMQIINRLETM